MGFTRRRRFCRSSISTIWPGWRGTSASAFHAVPWNSTFPPGVFGDDGGDHDGSLTAQILHGRSRDRLSGHPPLEPPFSFSPEEHEGENRRDEKCQKLCIECREKAQGDERRGDPCPDSEEDNHESREHQLRNKEHESDQKPQQFCTGTVKHGGFLVVRELETTVPERTYGEAMRMSR